ncbi:EipA family protein [uncultured Sphingomonas sp.]|uniref:DUF1134 domain-containing protein n=2 Tax=uncultured Sphingomonas sp. TaxID=158754 RepID=UPI0025D7B6AB|nr:EipA family protein [uncultured Sphingomonas sp.]
MSKWMRGLGNLVAAVAMAGLQVAPALAQVRSIDPNAAIDADVQGPQEAPRDASPRYPDAPVQAPPPATSATVTGNTARGGAPVDPTQTTAAADTFKRDDLIGAGEDVFGKGAEGFASLIEKILKEQGEPNAYIAGREASGAFILGLRYGSGIMTHKVEGQRPVYWTGPSVGFDVGGDANKVFVLVYNLYDTQELFKRFPGAEGRLYFVGGFAATYLRRGNVVLIPVRLGVGWRAGVNVGWMKFSEKSKWMPF